MEVGQSKQRDNASHFYERLLFVLRNLPVLLPFVMFPIGLLTHSGLADGRFYAGPTVFASIVGATALASLLYLVYKWLRKGHPLQVLETAFAILFHVLVVLFVLFVSGFLTVFLAIWIVLMAHADIRFGLKGLLTSFLSMCTTALLVLIIHDQLVIQGAIVVGLIAFVIARVISLTNRERNALAKLREDELYQRERLSALVNSMGDAVVATDDEGRIKLYNSSMLNLLDTNADLTDRQVDDVLQLLDKDNRPFSVVAEVRRRKTVFSRTDLQVRVPGEESMKLYINVAPVQPGYQSHAERGYIIIVRDITKEKTLEEERDEFVSVVSHELRTPVTIAEGNLSNIQVMFSRTDDKAAMQKAVADAHEQIVYLSKLVNDLSTLAKAERGTGGQSEQIDLHELLIELHKEYSPQATAKKLQLNLDIAPGLPSINANRLYLEEILQNLITNAIKYTQGGSVTIKAHLQDGDTAIEVVDTGIGISKADQEHVFEKFYRSEDYRTRESSGTGLGLYVVKKLAEKQGFKITMESRLNHGSTFTLSVPAKNAITSQQAEPPATPTNTAAQPSNTPTTAVPATPQSTTA